MAVLFLTTQVKALDQDNWGKLVRVLKYLNGTRYMKLILSADEIKVHHSLVCGWVPPGPQRLQRTNWMLNDYGEGSSDKLIKCNEMQYTKLY